MALDDEKRFEALKVLRDARWRSFDTRRSFEWKMCLALWTALAAFIAIMLQGTGEWTKDLNFWLVLAISVIGSLLVFGIHIWWNCNLHRSNKIDSQVMYLWEEAMQDIVGVQLTNEHLGNAIPAYLQDRASRLRKDIQKVQQEHKDNKLRKYWSSISECALTLLLLFIANTVLLGSLYTSNGTKDEVIAKVTANGSTVTTTAKRESGVRANATFDEQGAKASIEYPVAPNGAEGH